MFVPSQVRQFNAYNTAASRPAIIAKPPQINMNINQQQQSSFSATFQPATQVTLSSAPKLYAKANVPTVEMPPSIAPPPMANIEPQHYDMPTTSSGIKLKKSKIEKNQNIADEIIKAAKASSALQNFGGKDKKKLNKKTVRQAAGSTWEDPSLADWPDDDFRIFCGDLGNDVTDEILTRTFNKYPSFNKAKVIRDKRTNKSKGYGFISFREPQDFIRAMKEMDGRYVGTRPIKLRKSSWKNRALEEKKKKEAEKKALLSMINKY
jgi:hypothetical protein